MSTNNSGDCFKTNLYRKYNIEIKKIVDTYINDYDIIYINDVIISLISQEKNNIINFEKELNEIKLTLKKPHSWNDKKDIMKNILILENIIEDIKNDKLSNYEKSVNNLLREYIQLKKNNNIAEKHKIIDAYLTIAAKYINIKINRINNIIIDNNCNECNYVLTDIKMNNEGAIRCPKCKTYHQALLNKINLCDVKIQYINCDKDMENFSKALTRYEGLQDKPNKIIYQKLDCYFKERGLPTSDEIKKLPYNDENKKGNTNREMLCKALLYIGYSEYYEDTNLIGHIYWDWKLPDISHLKDKILTHYSITQKIFHKIPLHVRERISSLGTQYRLWRHLQLVGHDCRMQDFKIAENNDSLYNHHRIWKMMCELSQDPDIYYIE
jgi:predicted Zn-ribbon and HTH transcriptional regulator